MSIDLDALTRQYDEQGFVRVEKIFDTAKLAKVKEQIDRYCREIAPTLEPSEVTYEADGVSIRNLWRMNVHDSFFATLADDPALLEMVGKLVHGEPVLWGMETFSKPARVGSGVPPHQDNAYFCFEPADVLTVWIAVDAVTAANGPVFYVPGSHKLGMLAHRPSGVKGNSMGLAEPFDKSNVFEGTLKPGDAMIHHSQSIHYSAPNKTDFPRCGFVMVFRGKHTKESATLKAQYATGGAVKV